MFVKYKYYKPYLKIPVFKGNFFRRMLDTMAVQMKEWPDAIVKQGISFVMVVTVESFLRSKVINRAHSWQA